MDPRHFDQIRRLVHEQAGIALGPGKEALVSARVGKRLRALGLESIKQYLAHLEADGHGEELVQLLDAISTNVTSFFRESDHFSILAEHCRAWLAQGQRRLRLWSAACSSGEEPWTMAMVLANACANQHVDLGILATDISTKVLALARAGSYPSERCKTVPPDLHRRFLTREAQAGRLRVAEELRPLVTFRRLNLAKPPYPMRGPMDAILCRNVMIYFDADTRRAFVGQARRLLRPGGLLMVGHSESLNGMHEGFSVARPSVYQRLGGA